MKRSHCEKNKSTRIINPTERAFATEKCRIKCTMLCVKVYLRSAKIVCIDENIPITHVTKWRCFNLQTLALFNAMVPVIMLHADHFLESMIMQKSLTGRCSMKIRFKRSLWSSMIWSISVNTKTEMLQHFHCHMYRAKTHKVVNILVV